MTKHTVKTVLAAAAVTLAGSAAFAGAGYIKPGEAQNTNSGVTLELVRADSAGVVYAYDARDGVEGKVLGSAPVKAGANTNVRIEFRTQPLKDVLTVLYTDDTTTPAATAEVNDH
ncbi:hypothetical protein [Celeribacter sp. PS-C1]|uniref:hypothetical protein n=1 Tax=Celeribacter sp. PS-C1 TaxID=2820813 RepID=UPI001CA4B313|nr:hypothetical protein [Celeribacter sp. PS-C1]MBW6417046.1 hypothetical protein [Celeribacter sp. PS-C1]